MISLPKTKNEGRQSEREHTGSQRAAAKEPVHEIGQQKGDARLCGRQAERAANAHLARGGGDGGNARRTGQNKDEEGDGGSGRKGGSDVFIKEGERARHVFLCDQPRQRGQSDLPPPRPHRIEQKREGAAAQRQHALAAAHAYIAEAEIERKQHPQQDEEYRYHRCDFYYKLFCGKKQGTEHGAQARELRVRQFEHKLLLARDEPTEQQRGRKGEQDARRIQRGDGEEGVGKKGGGDGQIDGHLCAAADVAEYGDHPPLQRLVFQSARGEDGGGGTAEAHQQRKRGAPGQPRAAEQPVGEEGDRRKQAALFQQGERKFEQDDLREKGEQHADRVEKRPQERPRYGGARSLRRGGRPRADPTEQPLERILGEHARHPLRKGEKKHGQQQKGEQGQRQLLNIARAALSKAPILVLDEGKVIGSGKHDYLMENCEVYRQISDSQLGGALID